MHGADVLKSHGTVESGLRRRIGLKLLGIAQPLSRRGGAGTIKITNGRFREGHAKLDHPMLPMPIPDRS